MSNIFEVLDLNGGLQRCQTPYPVAKQSCCCQIQ